MNQNTCLHFQYMPMGLRVLYTSTLVVLGVGYLFAMIHIFASHAGRDGNPGLSVNDLVIAYSGSKSDTRLESALKGPMANMLPDSDRIKIFAWVRSGATTTGYTDSGVEAIVAQRCLTCHDGSNPHIPNMSHYEGIVKLAEMDTGMDFFTLIRVSHIHLFGITFIFFIASSIFCHTYIRPLWLKCVLIMTPFIAILMDIFSWYLTKLFTPFAWVVMFSGILMGLAFASQWILSVYQMWLYKMPQELIDKNGQVS